MKKVLIVCALLALATVASANVRIFLTLAGQSDNIGLDNFGSALIPTVSSVDPNNVMTNRFDYANADFTAGLHTINQTAQADLGPTGNGLYPSNSQAGITTIAAGQTAYIWLQFNRDGAGTYAACGGDKLNGLKLQGSGSASFTAAWYMQNDGVIANNKRWDGTATPPNYPEWITHNGQTETMVGVNAAGLVNNATDAGWNLYVGKNGGSANPTTQGRIALLGAIKFDANQSGTFNIVFPESEYNLNYSFANNATDTFALPTGIVVTPEPASLALLGLAGLLIRRR